MSNFDTDEGADEKRGRPKKGYVNFHALVPPKTKETIKAIALALNCSEGEAVAYAIRIVQMTAKRFGEELD